ncbi:MAG: DNA-binding protein [Rhodospirillaceae bacterium]|nr:DNA-binding protein [Rhodospirillaceae bacterium]
MLHENLRTVKDLAKEAKCFSVGKIRWWIFHADTNGMKSAIVKIDGRIYIDITEFWKWLETKRLAPRMKAA